MDDSLAPLFIPSSVAVIGASEDPTRIGGRPIGSMRLAGYGGAIYPVNPRYRTVQGLECYGDVRDIRGDIDLALIALPADRVAAAVAACADKGVRAITVFSSGFSEIGARGVQEGLVEVARAAHARVLGPNCMGTMTPRLGFVGTFTSTISEAPRAGPISVVSQSGAFAAHCFALLRARNVGIDMWAATGNEADVDAADCIAFMAASPTTSAILVCLEGIRNGDRFCEALALAQDAGKPVVMLKLGVSDVGASAVQSHTAALAGADRVLDAVLREVGVHRVRSVDQLMDAAYVLASPKRPKSRRVGIASVSGGFGILLADEAVANGMDVPELPADAQSSLRQLVPFAGTRNPLDLTAQFINEPALVEPMFEALVESVDGPLVLFLGASGDIPALFDRLTNGLERIARRHGDRVLLVCLIATPATRARLEAMGYLVFEDPSRAMTALALLGKVSERSGGGAIRDTAALPAPSIPDGSTAISEPEAKRLLHAEGIGIPPGQVAKSVDEAVSIAHRVGFPVVVKLVSREVQHKSDIGGVVLHVTDASGVAVAYAAVESAAHRAGVQCEGVLVEHMADDGIELIVGVQNDPCFGPILAVGLGGVHAEVLDDVVLHRAPVTAAGARLLIERLRGKALLLGHRGQQVDVDAAARAIAALSRFAAANAGVLEGVEINPLRVFARGAVALDALMTVRVGT